MMYLKTYESFEYNSKYNRKDESVVIPAAIAVEQSWRDRVLKFKCVYDSDNDENFNEEDYFKNLF